MEPDVTSDGEVVLRQVPRGLHTNDVIGALVACLAAGGDPTTYEDLMGWSGAAFRFQIRQPEWDVRSNHGTVGFDCLQCAAERLGRLIRRVSPDDRTIAVRIQIDQGRPLIHDQDSAGVVIGYRGDGHDVLVQRFDGGDDAWQSIDDWTWDTLYVVGSGPKTPAPLRVRFTRTVERAVCLLDGGEIPDPESSFTWYESGAEGLSTWAAQLRDGEMFERTDAEGIRIAVESSRAMVEALLDSRRCAVAFLSKNIATLGSSAERHLLRATTLMERSLEIASDAKGDLEWTQEARTRLSDRVARVAVLDEETAMELRSALTASGMSAPLV